MAKGAPIAHLLKLLSMLEYTRVISTQLFTGGSNLEATNERCHLNILRVAKWNPTSACRSGDPFADTPYENLRFPWARGARFWPIWAVWVVSPGPATGGRIYNLECRSTVKLSMLESTRVL